MNERILSSAILALGIVLAAFLIGGRYTILELDESNVWRLDRYTGKIWICGAETDDGILGCGPLQEGGRAIEPSSN